MRNIILIVCSVICTLVYGVLPLEEVHFIKDGGMDKVFPPVLQRTPGTPLGHLRPLGFQRHSSGIIPNTLGMPTAHAFSLKHVKPKKPVVIREGMLNMTAMNKWDNDDYLKKHYGKLTVSVSRGRDIGQFKKPLLTKTKTNLRRFLVDYKYDNIYLQDTLPVKMTDDLLLPGCLKCGTYRKRLQEAEIWMSYGRTSSLLHNHEDHMLHCVLFGRKDVIAMETQYSKKFDYIEKYPNAGSGYSPLDMEMVNIIQYQDIAKTPWTHATLREGDCLFLPVGYMHLVRSYGRCISYSILFAPSTNFDSSDCGMFSFYSFSQKEEEVNLADAEFVWSNNDGNRTLTANEMDSTTFSHLLDMLLRDKDAITREQFKHFYEAALMEFPGKPSFEDAYGLLTDDVEKQEITREELKTLSPKLLMKASLLFNEVRVKAKTKSSIKDEL